MSAIFLLLISDLAHAKNTLQHDRIEAFSLQQVRITDGPMAHAQDVNVQYLLALNPDKLLAPYLREAGLETHVDSYGNWENTGLDGHIGGHYLSALSLGWAASGEVELKHRLDYMISRLSEAQSAAGGYLGGIPDGMTAWNQIREGKIEADLFSLNGKWVPLYNIDKIYHGLRDAYFIGQNEQAKTMLIKLADWMYELVEKLTDKQIQQMLYSEHGGLNAVFVDVAQITGNQKYLDLSRRFSHLKIIEPLLEEKDQLDGLHANTQIPKIIGMLRYAETAENQDWIKAADYFWRTVTGDRTVSIGGNSVREHFHASNDFSPMIEDIEGPETCNTYNMMKLSLMLFKLTGKTEYLDYYERATYNHILSSQHPIHGGLVYFTSMRPGHYRTYSSVDDSMWCCVGSGIENHSKYGEFIYAKQGNDLLINMFVPSTLSWHERGLSLTQKTEFPDSNKVSLKLQLDKSKTFAIKIRKPKWFDVSPEFRVNDEKTKAEIKDGYLILKNKWRDGDNIEFHLPTRLHVEQLPDGQNYYSLLYGPVVLATKVDVVDEAQLSFVAGDSRMGHIADGPTCPPEALPIMLTKPEQFIEGIKRLPGPLAFKVSDFIGSVASENRNQTTTLIPFYQLHDSRYQVYWPQLDERQFKDYATNLKRKAAEEAALVASTVDMITPGQQQPEVEHNFKGNNTRAGINNGHHWRDAFGWFSYELTNNEETAQHLRIKYFKGDIDRTFDIFVNDSLLTTVSLKSKDRKEDFFYIDYPLNASMKKSKLLKLKFVAKPNSIAGGIYGIRLMR